MEHFILILRGKGLINNIDRYYLIDRYRGILRYSLISRNYPKRKIDIDLDTHTNIHIDKMEHFKGKGLNI